MSTLTTPTSRRLLEEIGQSIIVNAVEAGSMGSGSWARAKDYSWGSENGEFELGDVEYASVTLRELASQTYDSKRIEMHITHTMVADFIERVYALQMHRSNPSPILESLYALAVAGDEDADDLICDFDSVDADAVLQHIMFGEVVYG